MDTFTKHNSWVKSDCKLCYLAKRNSVVRQFSLSFHPDFELFYFSNQSDSLWGRYSGHWFLSVYHCNHWQFLLRFLRIVKVCCWEQETSQTAPILIASCPSKSYVFDGHQILSEESLCKKIFFKYWDETRNFISFKLTCIIISDMALLWWN